MTDPLYAAVSEAVKKLTQEIVTEKRIARVVTEVTKKEIDEEKLTEMVSRAKNRLHEKVMEGVDKVIKESEIPERLDELKEYSKNSSKGTKGWRPTGVPEQDTAGHLQPVMKDFEKNMTEIEQKLGAEIKEKQVLCKELETRAQELIRKAGYDPTK